MNTKYHKLWIMPSLALLLLGCASHYCMSGISRSRILIDKRYDVPPGHEANIYLAPYKAKIDSLMSPMVGTAATDLFKGKPEGALSNLMPDIMVWAGSLYGKHPEIGFYNQGGIRAGFRKGNVTIGDVLEVAPFENRICFFTLKGKHLLEVFEQMARRGGECVSHGVNLIITADGKLIDAKFNGQPIDPERDYHIATIDYLSEGNDGMVSFKKAFDMYSPSRPEDNARAVIEKYFKAMAAQGKAVDAKTEGRIIIQ